MGLVVLSKRRATMPAGALAVASGRRRTYNCAVVSRLGLAALVGAALGLVGGFVIGGVGPRRELADAQREIDRLEAELESGGGGWRSPVPGLDRILRNPGGDDADTPSEPAPVAEASEETASEGETVAVPGVDGGVPRESWRDRWRSRARESREERYDAFTRAAAVQRVRRVQSRAALVEQAELTEEEEAELDTVLGDLNDSLAGYGEEILMLAARDEPPPARDLLGITHDVTGIMASSQRRLEALLGPERMGQTDPSALEIWNHVDLDRLEPAARAALERRGRR
jgi:hypothetical protein